MMNRIIVLKFHQWEIHLLNNYSAFLYFLIGWKCIPPRQTFLLYNWSSRVSIVDRPKFLFSSDVPALPPILDGIAGPECSEIQDVVEASRIHSRRFREYCDQVIDKQIDELASFILSELNRFYQRQLQKNQIKAKSKRRFVLGIREVFKHLKLNKIKCVVVSPNLEKIQSKGKPTVKGIRRLNVIRVYGC